MAAVADGALDAGGEVVGVMPRERIRKGYARHGLSRLIEVADMRERQAVITGLAHAFLVLPGGLGTCLELFDVLTWRQLGLSEKPIVLCNPEGFFDLILGWLDRASTDGRVSPDDRHSFRVVTNPVDAVSLLGERCHSSHLERPDFAQEDFDVPLQ
jgi:uncharacterized protein (TIGR00730 family)